MRTVNWIDHLFNVAAVIIGVSLAFWVSDSAEKRKSTKELNFARDSFIEELISDSLTYVSYQIPDNTKQVEVISQVIGMLNGAPKDSLEYKFERAIGLNSYHPISNTFNSLTSSGKLDLFEDLELKQKLSAYYTIYSLEAEWRGKFQVEFYSTQLLPWLTENIDFLNPDFDSINKVQLTNLLMIYAGLIENKIRQYEVLAGQADSLCEELKTSQDE